MSTLLEQTKVTLDLKTEDQGYEEEILGLIAAAIADLKETAGIDTGEICPTAEVDMCDYREALLAIAIKTYVRMNFKDPEDYERLKESYYNQKAQLKTRYSEE